jgi:hypothetical protein
VETGIVAKSFDPVNILNPNERDFASSTNCETLRAFNARALALERILVSIAHHLMLPEIKESPGAVKRIGKTNVVYGFEEIIERLYFKRVRRIYSVRGEKNYARYLTLWQRTQDIDAGNARHLNVKQQKVRCETGNGLNRFLAATTLSD